MTVVGFKNSLKHIAAAIACLAFVLMLFTGCGYKGYSGKNVDLYTVAVNSVLWNNGYSYSTERVIDPQIEIIETDEFGRTLFTYYEQYYSGGGLSFSALIVAQGVVDGVAYYYEDCNFLIKEQAVHTSDLHDFSEEEKEYLKDLNDWGKTVDFQSCTQKKTDKNKQSIPVDDKIIICAAIDEFNLSDKPTNVFVDCLTYDSCGNCIVYGMIRVYESDSVYFGAYINTDGEIVDWLVPQDLYNYQNELKNFKKKNGWQYIK